MDRFLLFAVCFWVACLLTVAVARAETPVVVFDLPLTVECRDVTPQRYEAAYQRKIFEAVVRISPQLQEGEEKDLKKLHYEISTEQQMPVVSYAPSSQVTSDVAGGSIAIQTDDHHGQLLVHYLITPAAGDGTLKADLNSSHAQYMLLAPKQILVASGTIERGCGVYYELKPSTQDTLQKQREFACLFEVPAAWRADYITVSVGLYRQDDGEAKEVANQLARRQQACLDRKIRPQAMNNFRSTAPAATASAEQAAFDLARERMGQERASVLRGRQEKTDLGSMKDLLGDPEDAGDKLSAAKEAIRKLNGKL
jgi:hypothetical protein